MNIKEIIPQLTLEEKAALCSGADGWHTVAVKRLGIPPVRVSDGPHGLRCENGTPGDSEPATCFPSGSALGCSWDESLLSELGSALSAECRAQNVSVLLGPAVNIKRSPLCGRNFEYYSEDPLLSSSLAAACIKGVRGGGTGVALKHFAANNKETHRLTTDTVVDERTLREIYLASFETAVKEARPWTIMCAYNKLNGVYCSENRRLLTDILRDEWKFDGLVMSDWGAVSDRDKAVAAGLDLEMPGGSDIGPQKIIDAVQSGSLSETELNRCVARVLQLAFRAEAAGRKAAAKEKAPSYAEHHALARKIAQRCMVLLKNDGVLPLKKTGRLAVIGAFAKKQRYQGGGSSHIHPTQLDVPIDELQKAAPALAISYSEGYSLSRDQTDEALIHEACAAAAAADAAVVFAGLPDSYESEGFDRTHMRMPESHCALISAVSAVQKHTVVVLSNGAPVEMPWIDDVPAVLESYLCGQAAGGAQAAILFGDVNPSGKLAETFPRQLSDNPSFLNFPGDSPNHVQYHEGVFVGYRYYEKKKMAPLFPFGHGLSYTTFAYTGMTADKAELREDETLSVRVTVANTGARAGREIVQLYVRDIESSVMRPVKELRGFKSVALAPGEKKTVTFSLSKRAFAFYDVGARDWRVEDGAFELLAGGSSANTPLRATVTVHPLRRALPVFSRHTLTIDVWNDPQARELLQEFLARSGVGETLIQQDWMRDMPLRNLFMFGAKYTQKELDRLIDALNSITK